MKYSNLFLASIFCLSGVVEAAPVNGWHVEVHDFSKSTYVHDYGELTFPDSKSEPSEIKLMPSQYYFRGSFELPSVGYTCHIVEDGEVITEVVCKNKLGEGVSLYSPRPRNVEISACDSKKQVDETAFSSVNIFKNGRTIYSLTIGAGSNYPCVFKLDVEPKESDLKK